MFEDLEAKLVTAFRLIQDRPDLVWKANLEIQSLDSITLTDAGIHFTQSPKLETQESGLKLFEVACRRWRELDDSCRSRIKAGAQSLFRNLDESDGRLRVPVSMLLKMIISHEDSQFLEDVLKNHEHPTPVRTKQLFTVLELLAEDQEQQPKLHSVLPELIKQITQTPSLAKPGLETISLLALRAPVDDLLLCLSELSSLMTEVGVLLPFSKTFLAISRRDLQSDSLQTLLKLFSEFCRVCLAKLTVEHAKLIAKHDKLTAEDDKLISCLCSTLDELSDNQEDGSYVDLVIMFLEHKVFALHSHAVHRCADLLRKNKLTLTRENFSVVWGMIASHEVPTEDTDEQYTNARDLVVDRIVDLYPTIATEVLQYALKGFNETATSQEASEVQQKFWAAVQGLLSSTTERSHVDDFLENILQSGSSSAKRFTFCFAGLSPYFRAHPEKLPRCIQKLMDFFISVQDDAERDDISEAFLLLASVGHYSAFFNPLLNLMKQHGRENSTLRLVVNLRRSVFISLANSSLDDQTLVLGSLLQQEHWTTLNETYLASFDLFTGALKDLSDAFDEPMKLLREALQMCDQYKYRGAMVAHVRAILPRILKVISFLHSLWDPADSSRLTPVIKAALEPLRSSCYMILIQLSESLSDVFFCGMIEFAEPLSGALLMNIVKMELHHFSQLLQVIISFVKRCPAQVFSTWHDPLITRILSLCRPSSDPTVPLDWEITPDICMLFEKELYPEILSKAVAVVQQPDAEKKDFCLKLVVDNVAEFWSESKPVLESLPGMLKKELKRLKADVDGKKDFRLVEKRLLSAKELAATRISLKSAANDILIHCDARLGYAVTRVKLDSDGLTSINQFYGSGEIWIQKLYLSTAPDVIQSEMLIRCVEPQVYLTKWLVSGYQRALVALLLTVPKETEKVLVIGFGGGTLSMFLRDVLHLRVTSVDIDHTVVSLAKTHFGVEEDDKLEIHIDDGLKFVKNESLHREKYDAVIVDVFSDQSGPLEGIDGPPSEFLEQEFLADCRKLIHENGALLVNTIITTKSEELVIDRCEHIQNILSKATGERVLSILADDNVCFIAYASRQNSAVARGMAGLMKLRKDKDYHGSCLKMIEKCLFLTVEGQFGESRHVSTD